MGAASWIPKNREKRRSLKIGPIEPVPPHRRTGREESWRRRRTAPENGEGERREKRGGESVQEEGFRRDGHGGQERLRSTKIVSDAFESNQPCHYRSLGFYRFPNFVALTFHRRYNVSIRRSQMPVRRTFMLDNVGKIPKKFGQNLATIQQ